MPNNYDRPGRRERRSRPLPLTPLFALAILAVGIAFAQQNLPVPPSPTAPAAENTAEPATTDENGAADDAAADAAPPAKPAAAKGSPQRFEPTEKVRPDFDVAFPVDI